MKFVTQVSNAEKRRKAVFRNNAIVTSGWNIDIKHKQGLQAFEMTRGGACEILASVDMELGRRICRRANFQRSFVEQCYGEITMALSIH
jgi:hypothetical protein